MSKSLRRLGFFWLEKNTHSGSATWMRMPITSVDKYEVSQICKDSYLYSAMKIYVLVHYQEISWCRLCMVVDLEKM